MKSLLVLLIVPFLLCQVCQGKERSPNIVLVLVDDMGWMDLGCQGSEYYQTPNIDRLSSEGMRFTNGYAACAVCSPSRAAIQTGRYPHRIGVTDWIRSLFQRGKVGTPEKNPTDYIGGKNRRFLCPPNPYWMEHEEITIAEALGAEGYQTAYVGKWHLGDEAWYPEGQGYVVNRGGCDYGQPPSYFDPFNNPKHKHATIREGIYKLPGRQPGQYLTHREAEEVDALIRQWKDEPFFIQLSHYAVHTPIQAIPEVAAKYEGAKGNQKNAKYAAMVESVDDAMGKILDTLTELKLAKDTMVIFTSDNGGLVGPTHNGPLRSGKGYAYEGGVRVPFIAWWPGEIAAGKVSDTPVCSIDVFPTILDFAGVAAPADRKIDGLSLASFLRSGGNQMIERDELFWHFPHYRHDPGPYSMIRKGDYKLIKFWDGPMELYDLKNDVSESRNLADVMPEKVSEMDRMLTTRLKADQARLPKLNPDFVAK